MTRPTCDREGLLPWLALLVSGCLVPRVETHRPSLTVSVVAPEATRLAVCTWSSWSQPDAGCADQAVVPLDGAEVVLPAYTTGPPTLIFGEAPLMETLLVACADDDRAVGTTGLAVAFDGSEATVEAGGMRVLGSEGLRTTRSDEAWSDVATRMCARSGGR